ncbi:uncharacterized protein [Ptychodera flava]|uniref:uncharacterized protein n=1 Tax=Ptychodera flava TaxID=63121 RepID=UPI00396A954A
MARWQESNTDSTDNRRIKSNSSQLEVASALPLADDTVPPQSADDKDPTGQNKVSTDKREVEPKINGIPICFRMVRCDHSVEIEYDKNKTIDPSSFPYEDFLLTVEVTSTLDQCRQKLAESFSQPRFSFLRKGNVIPEDKESKTPVFHVLSKTPGKPLKDTYNFKQFKGLKYRTVTWKGKERTVVALVNAVVVPDEKVVDEEIGKVNEADVTDEADIPEIVSVCFRIHHSTVTPIVKGTHREPTEQQTMSQKEDRGQRIPTDEAEEQNIILAEDSETKETGKSESKEDKGNDLNLDQMNDATLHDSTGNVDDVNDGTEKYPSKDVDNVDSVNINKFENIRKIEESEQMSGNNEQVMIKTEKNRANLLNGEKDNQSRTTSPDGGSLQSGAQNNSYTTDQLASGRGETKSDKVIGSEEIEENQSIDEEPRAIYNSFEDVILPVDKTTTLEHCREKIEEKTRNDMFFFLKNGNVIPKSKEGRIFAFQVLPKAPSKNLEEGFRYQGVCYQSTKWNDRVVLFAALINVVPVPEGGSVQEVLQCLGPSRIEGGDIPDAGFDFIPFDQHSRMMTLTPAGLHEAATYGRTDFISTILSTFKSLNPTHLKDTRKATPLHYAAANGHNLALEYLLDDICKDHINVTDVNDRTPLHLAIYYKKFMTVALLLQRGASVRGKKDVNGNTPMSLLQKLPLTFWESHIDSLVLPTDLARHVASKMIVENRTDKLDKVVDHIADVNARDLLHRTLLHEALEAKSEKAVHLLLDKEVRKDVEDLSGCTPLCIASRQGDEGMVERLLPGITVQRQLCHALVHAVERKEVSVILRLLNNPAMKLDDVTRVVLIRQLDGGRLKREDILNILRACRDTLINQRFLGWISTNGTKDHVQHFVSTDIDVSMPDYLGRTVLHEATQKGDLDLVQYLLEKTQADPNIGDWRGSTPLHYACEKGHNDIAHFLLERENVLASIQDTSGRTPLLAALYSKKTTLALSMVVKFGEQLQLSVMDRLGHTALHFTYLFKENAEEFVAAIKKSERQHEEQERNALQDKNQEGCHVNYNLVDKLWSFHLDDELQPVKRLSKAFKERCNLAISGTESERESVTSTQSPLCLAVISGNLDAVLALCKNGDDMDSCLPLELAVSCNKNIIVDTLLEKYRQQGIDRPALSAECEYELKKIMSPRDHHEFIHPEYGPELHRACKLGNTSAVKELLKQGADITVAFKGQTCLDVCINERNEEIALAVLEHCMANDNMYDMVGDTGLADLVLKAAKRDQWSIVNKLINLDEFNETSIDVQLSYDNCRQTIIHHMARAGQMKMLHTMLCKDVNAVNMMIKNERTPLWFAIANGHWKVAKLLLLYNSNPLITKASVEGFLHRFQRGIISPFDSALTGGCVIAETSSFKLYEPTERAKNAHKITYGSKSVAEVVFQCQDTATAQSPDSHNAKSLTGGHSEKGTLSCDETVKHATSANEKAPYTTSANKISENTVNRPSTTVDDEKQYQEVKALFKLASKAARSSSSVLHLAAAGSNLEHVQAILDFRPDLLNVPDSEGNTPVFYAALAGKEEIISYLLGNKKCEIHASTVLTLLLAYYINSKRLSLYDVYLYDIKRRTTVAKGGTGMPCRQIQGTNSSVHLIPALLSTSIWMQKYTLIDTLSIPQHELAELIILLIKKDPKCINDSRLAQLVTLVLCLLHDKKILEVFLDVGFDLHGSLEKLNQEHNFETMTPENLIISIVAYTLDCIDGALECFTALKAENSAISMDAMSTLTVKAAACGEWAVLEKLIKCKPFHEWVIWNKPIHDGHGKSILHHLAKAGKLSYIEEVLKKDFMNESSVFDSVDHSMRTPLWYALAFKHYEVAKRLILHGACPSKCQADVRSLVQMFLRPRKVLKCSSFGVHETVFKQYDDSSSVVMQKKEQVTATKNPKKVNINIRLEDKETEGTHKLITEVDDKEQKQCREIELLLKLAYEAAMSSKSILHEAAAISHFEYVQAILEFRPDFVTVADSEGHCPLVYAGLSGNKEIVRLILDMGASKNHASTLFTLLLAYYINHEGLSQTHIHSKGSVNDEITDYGKQNGEESCVQNTDPGEDCTYWQIKVHNHKFNGRKMKGNQVPYVCHKIVSLLIWQQRRVLTNSLSIEMNDQIGIMSLLLNSETECLTDSKSAPFIGLLLCLLHDEKILKLFLNAGFNLCNAIKELVLPRLLLVTSHFGRDDETEAISIDPITLENLIISTVCSTPHCIDGALECLDALHAESVSVSKSGISRLALAAAACSNWVGLENIMKHKPFEELTIEEKLIQDKEGKSILHYLAKAGRLTQLEHVLKDCSLKGSSAFDSVDCSMRTPLWYAIAFRHWEVAKRLFLLGCCPIKCKINMECLMHTFRKYDKKQTHIVGQDVHSVFTVGKLLVVLGGYLGGQGPPQEQMPEILQQQLVVKIKQRTGRKIVDAALQEKYGSSGIYESIFKRPDVIKTLVKQMKEREIDVVKDAPKILKNKTNKQRKNKEGGLLHKGSAQEVRADTGNLQAMKDVRHIYDLAMYAANNGATLLHVAAGTGDITLLKKTVSYRKDLVNCLDSSRMTALFYAARAGHEETVSCLLENGADPKEGVSPLLASTAMWFLTGIDTNANSYDVFNSPLRKFLPEEVKRLMTTRCNFLLDSKRRTVKWKAITKLLLPRVKDVLKMQELLLLAFNILCDKATADEFRSNGFDVIAALTDVMKDQPLDVHVPKSWIDMKTSIAYVICATSMSKMSQSNIATCLNAILQKAENESVKHMLLLCVRNGLWNVIYILVDKFNLQLDGMTIVSLILICAEENQVNVVQSLLASLDMTGGLDSGLIHLLLVALHTSCQRGHIQIVEMLLQAGQVGVFTKVDFANDKPGILWEIKFKDGFSYEDTCQWHVNRAWNYIKVCVVMPAHLELNLDGQSKVLKNTQYRPHWTAFHWACHSGKFDVLNALERIAGGIEKAKGDMAEHFDATELLYVSTVAGHSSVFSYLCENWDLDSSNRTKVSHLWEESHKFKFDCEPSPTLMEIAAVHGHCKIVTLLLQKAEQQGSDIELIRYPDELEPLSLYHVASFFGWRDVTDTLVRLGVANKSRKDGCDLTPAAYALVTGRRSLYEQLCRIELEENGVLDNHYGQVSAIMECETICPFGWLHQHLQANENVKEVNHVDLQPSSTAFIVEENLNERRRVFFDIPKAIELDAREAAKCMITASAIDMPHFWQNGDRFMRLNFIKILSAAVNINYTDIIDLLLAAHEEVHRNEILDSCQWLAPFRRGLLRCSTIDNQESIQKLIDYGAKLPDGVLDGVFSAGTSDGVIAVLRNNIAPETIRRSEGLSPAVWACAVGRNELLSELVDDVPPFDVHIKDHKEDIDPECFHCLRNQSVGWFDKFLKRMDVAKNDMVITKSASKPRPIDRISLPEENLQMYHWILGHGSEMTDFIKITLRTAFYNTSDNLEDIGCNQESICYLLKACYTKKPINKKGEARVPNSAIIALDKAIELTPETSHDEVVQLFIDFHRDVEAKELLHIAAILHLKNLTQALVRLCDGDTEFKGQTVEEIATAFNNKVELS